MPITKQARKYATGLAGEFLVAGELLRRGIAAAVTYGNAKKADVVAIHNDRATSLEVKSTTESKWVLGRSIPKPTMHVWILVFLPPQLHESPQYFILTASELHDLLMPEHTAYIKKFRDKHGRESTAGGVVSIQRKLLSASHAGAWHKVNHALGSN